MPSGHYHIMRPQSHDARSVGFGSSATLVIAIELSAMLSHARQKCPFWMLGSKRPFRNII